MEFKYNLTNKISEFIKDATLEEINIGYSDSQVIKINKKEELYFLKIAKKGLLTNEYKKLKWLQNELTQLVPEIILYEETLEAEFLLTKSLKGEMVCSEYYLKNPSEGMKIVIDAFEKITNVNIENCPFNVALDYKLSLVRYNLDNNLIEEKNVDEEILKKYGSLEGIYNYLVENKFEEELVFSHGDISLPNIFAYENKLSGFIDLGDAGIADKWFDIAIATRTIIFNYGKEYLSDFYKGINVTPDENKINYYLTMMELYL